jgi:hypothetical protein
MARRGDRGVGRSTPRHSVDWYDQRSDPYPLSQGDRLFIRCEGGPCTSRLETFPPSMEIEEPGGTYVLIDDGSRHEWHYVWAPST